MTSARPAPPRPTARAVRSAAVRAGAFRARLRVRALACGGALGACVVAVVVALGPALRSPSAPLPVITVAGLSSEEGCLACHAHTQGLGPAHAAFGCSPCHEGDAGARDADAAHRGMVVLVGDLARVGRSCGRAGCHASEAARVQSSLMATAPGILAVDRFAFGERRTPDGSDDDGLDVLASAAPTVSGAAGHARQLCASCHLGLAKERRGDLGVEARGGGCTACHLAAPWIAPDAPRGPLHPDVSAAVPEKRCVGCHARSGRIALSFRGVVELEPNDARVTGALPDGRPIGAAPPDVHARAGMTCIDCHNERELMGDGTRHRHAHEALETSCGDCHLPLRAERPPSDPDREAVAEVLRRAWQRRGRAPLSATPLVTRRGTPLVRTDAPARTLVLAEGGGVRPLPLARPAAYHELRGHERLSCQACHSAWAPRCTSCHTRFEPEGAARDLLTGAVVTGRWVERAGGNGFGPPLLAVGPRGTIDPFVEGMRFELDDDAGRHLERELYAPLEPHTTGAARACPSCHDGAAPTGAAGAAVGLDAVYPARGETTRSEARLLGPLERTRIARVGRCLACHARYEDAIYRDFAASRASFDAGTARGCAGPRPSDEHAPASRSGR